MVDSKVIKECSENCLADCEDVRFSINKQEIPINVELQCDGLQNGKGYDFTQKLLKKYVLQSQVLEYFDKPDILSITLDFYLGSKIQSSGLTFQKLH